MVTHEYKESWKVLNGYYNYTDFAFLSDQECDYYEEQKYCWGESTEYYDRIKENKQALMIFMDILEKPKPIAGQLDPEEIKSSIRLSYVIGQYAKIRRVGTDKYQASCPFHDDRLPSLSIDDKKGLWYCHAEGIGGDVFSFLMKANNLSFRESLELANTFVNL